MKIIGIVDSPVKQRKFGDRIVCVQTGYALPNYPQQHPSVPVQIELREGQVPLTGLVLLSYKVMSGPYDTLKLPEKYALICAYQLKPGQIEMLGNVLGEVQAFVESGVAAPVTATGDSEELKQQIVNLSALNAQQAAANAAFQQQMLEMMRNNGAAPVTPVDNPVARAASNSAAAKTDSNPNAVPPSPYQAALDAQAAAKK